MFSMVISVVILADFGDFGELCYPLLTSNMSVGYISTSNFEMLMQTCT